MGAMAYPSQHMLEFRSIRWRIAVPLAILTAAILAGLYFFSLSQFRQYYLDQLRERLTANTLLLSSDGGLIAGLAESRWQAGDTELVSLVNDWSAQLDARVTVMQADGMVLADSRVDPLSMGNQADQPEVRAALTDAVGYTIRVNQALGSEMIYASAAVASRPDQSASGDSSQSEATLGVLRVSVPRSDVFAVLSPLRRVLLLAMILALAAGAAISFLLAEDTARPFRHLIEVAARLAQGELGARIEPQGSEEAGQLARIFNRMRDRLEAQVTSLTRERERLTSVLNNLVDGVFILDSEGRVRRCNLVAARMVGIETQISRSPSETEGQGEVRGEWESNEEVANPSHFMHSRTPVSHLSTESLRGQPLAQIVRDHRIVETWQACRDDSKQTENIFQWGHRTMRVIALPFVAGGSGGYMVLLQDMTELHRLERVRRDFVSNISHELRTPLASLRALTETLRDGALDDPAAAPRFLDSIETEVDALAQMVQELLELSRIESGQVPFRFLPVPVSDTVLTPVERMQPLAARGNIELIVDLPPRLPRVYADAERIHQVITNLVHNALKFSSAGGSVTISASDELRDQRVTVSVIDSGIGVPAEDRDRIFERFYKTDRARAGGGTGLGLAIAKHIIQAHGGQIWVDSIENRGSTFSFTLSAAPNGDRSHEEG